MRTLKFKAQPTNTFFATVNQMLGGSSQLPATAGNQIVEHSSDNETILVLGSCRKLEASHNFLEGDNYIVFKIN